MRFETRLATMSMPQSGTQDALTTSESIPEPVKAHRQVRSS